MFSCTNDFKNNTVHINNIIYSICAGIGKTTLANEICVNWAKRDGFLADDYEILILIPLRSVQQRSIEEVMTQHIGEETYHQVMSTAGNRCLLILEGLDEMAFERRKCDPFLIRVMECTILEEATIIITSRPHACRMIVNAGRRIEIVGFGKNEIKEFVEKSFHNNVKCVKAFLQQLKEYPQLESLSYVPMNLALIIDIFECSNRKLPSTLTELYQLFIMMTLERQVKKNSEKSQLYSALITLDSAQESLGGMLGGVPQETVGTLLLLSKLAYHSFFTWSSGERWKNEPRIIFTVEDLKECNIDVTPEWDGYGLMKARDIRQLPTDIITYNFSHLSIQEFLCAVYITTLSQNDQQYLLNEKFFHYQCIFQFFCGLTGLTSDVLLQALLSNFQGVRGTINLSTIVCLYESQHTIPVQFTNQWHLI